MLKVTVTMLSDAKTIFRLLRPTRGDSHRDRLNDFYGAQANGYDAFREKAFNQSR